MPRQILTLCLGPLVLALACSGDVPTAPTASSLSVSGASVVMELETVTLAAQARNNGQTIDVTRNAEWTTDAPQIATVDGGVVRGVAVGNATVTATYVGRTAMHQIEVTRRTGS